MRRGTQEAIDIAQGQPAIRERTVDALRHQVDGTHILGDGAEIGLGRTDDRGRAALQPVHHTAPTGVNTG